MHLIINADDFGISDSVNLAVDYCMRNGIVQRTSLMVNMDSSENAVILARKNLYSDKVGLHLNLTEGVPLTEPIKSTFFCTNGFFNGQALKKQKNRFFLNKKVRETVVIELKAQIEKYIRYGFTLFHVDSHQHVHTNPSVFKLLSPLMKEYGFLSCRLSRNIPEYEITGLKKIYKDIFNKKVNAFNTYQQRTEWHVEYFGSQNDVDKISSDLKYQDSTIEVEVHPYYKEYGKLEDLLNPVSVDKWRKKYELS